MPTRSRLLAALFGLLVFASPSGAQTGSRFEDEQLQPLAASLKAYFEARALSEGLEQVKTDLLRSLAKLQPPGERVRPVARSVDLGRAFWLSKAYPAIKRRRGKVTKDEHTSGTFAGGGLKYAYRVPADYEPSTAYPLLLVIPDEDERPDEHLRESWTLPAILDGAILVCPEMPAELGEWDRVMIDGRPGGLSHVLTAYRIATERFAVDFDRVYVVGRGKGVPAAVAAGNYGPQRFAGVIGRAGDTGDIGPANFSNLPTLFVGAGARASAFKLKAESAGSSNCHLNPTGKEGDIWSWVQAHPREAHPTRVTLVPGDPFPTRAYWLRVAPSAADSRTTATVESETNTIRIESAGVSRVTLYLSDELVDLDKPVRIIYNGVTHETLIPPYLPSALDMLADGTSDAGCVYLAEIVLATEGGAPPSILGIAPARDPELERLLASADDDIVALRELYTWCESTNRTHSGAGVLRRILRLDPSDPAARQALGHQASGTRWFTSEHALVRFNRSQDEESAAASGRVLHKGLWVHPDERALINKGLVKDLETGQWLSAVDRQRLADGWVRQDFAWIPPDEAVLADSGAWLVDGEWLDEEQANRRHSRPEAMWHIPGAEVVVLSTAQRAVALHAQTQMERALVDLRRVFGAEPVLPLIACVLKDEEQYDRFAFGDPDGRRPATHTGRLHVIHSAFFAENWFRRVDGKPVFQGMGVCFWDPSVPNGNLYGVHSARLAIGLSYVDALDPSTKTVRKAVARGPGADYYDAFVSEKKLPAWLRYGGAVYAERFFMDDTVGSDGDPWWPRRWSIENLITKGGRMPLEDVLDFPLDPDDREAGLKLLIDAGLVVAFMLDGECAAVSEAHAAFKTALATGRLHANHLDALTEALLAHEAELAAFAAI